jgi:hypothetical protein
MPDGTPTKGLLFSQMEPPPGLEAEFHDWYETEHIPARMAIAGFASADRYEVVDGAPRFLACYHLNDLGVLDSPQYRQLKSHPGERTRRMLASVSGFTRYTCRLVSDTGAADDQPTLMFAVAFDVPAPHAAEFDAWYGEEHIPLLMRIDSWKRVRRYARTGSFDGAPWTHLALHDLADRRALTDPQRAAARATARRAQLARHEWFRHSWRWLYRPIHHARPQVAR